MQVHRVVKLLALRVPSVTGVQLTESAQALAAHPAYSLDAIDRKLVGFDGGVRKGIYGTSFAAPRVAWFLAFAESIRSEKVKFSNWFYLQRTWILHARQPTGSPNQYLFRPMEYLQQAVGP